MRAKRIKGFWEKVKTLPGFGTWEELQREARKLGLEVRPIGLGTVYCCAQDIEVEVVDPETGHYTSFVFTEHPEGAQCDCPHCACGQ